MLMMDSDPMATDLPHSRKDGERDRTMSCQMRDRRGVLPLNFLK